MSSTGTPELCFTKTLEGAAQEEFWERSKVGLDKETFSFKTNVSTPGPLTQVLTWMGTVVDDVMFPKTIKSKN